MARKRINTAPGYSRGLLALKPRGCKACGCDTKLWCAEAERDVNEDADAAEGR